MRDQGEGKAMNKQKVPAFILLIALICLGVFFDAPLVPRLDKTPCYVGAIGPRAQPAFYLNATEWMSSSYALFGFGVDILPANPCPIAP